MPKKTFTPEQIVGKLRQIEVLVSQGKTVPLACKDSGDHDQTYYRWRQRVWRPATGAGQEAERSAEGKRAAQARPGHSDAGKTGPEGYRGGKLLSPVRRRIAVQHARDKGIE